MKNQNRKYFIIINILLINLLFYIFIYNKFIKLSKMIIMYLFI